MQAGLEALLLQIDVLREAHEGVTASHTKLEGKLRLEGERARKLNRLLNAQREGVGKAAAKEAEARSEAEALRNKVDDYRASLQLEEQQGREDRDKYNRLAVELRRAHEDCKEELKHQQERGRALEAERSYLEAELHNLQEEHEALKHKHR